MFGVIEIDGKKYIERKIVLQQIITVANTTPIRTQLNLPGVSDFILKGLVRDTLVAGVSTARRFLFRLGNSEGATFYHFGGVGTTQDRVLDTLTFGDARFPFPWSPPIFYSKDASIKLEIESVAAAHPYDLYIGFIGSYLIPA